MKNDVLFTAATAALSYEEECYYSELVHSSEEYERLYAQNKLAEANEGLVKHIAARYMNRGVSFEDLVGYGREGLVIAINRFEPSRGCRFSTFAGRWIEHSIQTGIEQTGGAIRVPKSVRDAAATIMSYSDSFASEYGYEPTSEELASTYNIGYSASEIDNIRTSFYGVDSLDDSYDDDSSECFGDHYADESEESPVDFCNRMEDYEKLYDALDKLPEREKFVLFHIRGLAGSELLSKTEIAKQLGISVPRIAQIEERAIKLLSELLSN